MIRVVDGVKSVVLFFLLQNRQGWFYFGCILGFSGRFIYIIYKIYIYFIGILDIKILIILCIDFYKWMIIYLCYLGEVDIVLVLVVQVCLRLNSLIVRIFEFYLRIFMFGVGRDVEGSRVEGRKRDIGYCDFSSFGVGD